MTQPKIYVNESGTLLYIQDCPIDEPKWNYYQGAPSDKFIEDHTAYQSALELAVNRGVEFKDQEQVKYLLEPEAFHFGNGELKGKFFDLPSGYSVQVKEDGELNRDGKLFAILKSSDNSAHSKEEDFDDSVQFEIINGDRFIKVNCPDEDDDIFINVRHGKQYAGISLNLDEAEELANYILGHVKNARVNL